MSNKQQLQTNNEKYASLIETLRGKAIPSGSEDLDTELTEQENLISQLSTILDSKASGGGGSVGMCTASITCTSEILGVGYSAISDAGALEYIEPPLPGTTVTTYSFQCVPNTLIQLITADFEMVRIQQNMRQEASHARSSDYLYYFLATAEAGGTASIIMSST